MKRTVAMLALAAGLCPFVARPENPVVAATLRSDGTTNTWTQAELQDALGLLNRKYWRDMQTDSGRRQWHGSCRTSIDSNLCIRVWRYEDGFAWTNRWTRPVSDVERAAKVAARRAQILAARTNGLPSPVADIIARRTSAANGETNVVTVTIMPNP